MLSVNIAKKSQLHFIITSVKDHIRNITAVTSVIIGVSIVKKIGHWVMLKIRKNKIYKFDNGFDDVEIVLCLEDEKDIRYDDKDIVFNSTLDFVEVLIGNMIESIMLTHLYEIKGIEYNV